MSELKSIRDYKNKLETLKEGADNNKKDAQVVNEATEETNRTLKEITYSTKEAADMVKNGVDLSRRETTEAIGQDEVTHDQISGESHNLENENERMLAKDKENLSNINKLKPNFSRGKIAAEGIGKQVNAIETSIDTIEGIKDENEIIRNNANNEFEKEKERQKTAVNEVVDQNATTEITETEVSDEMKKSQKRNG